MYHDELAVMKKLVGPQDFTRKWRPYQFDSVRLVVIGRFFLSKSLISANRVTIAKPIVR
jgi:hypothetical protein